MGLSPLNANVNSLSKSVYYVLPDGINNGRISLTHSIAEYLGVSIDEVKQAERVIAKALLELLPVVTLNDGCKAALLIEESSGKPFVKPVAIKCRINGYALRLNCPILTSIMNKGNLLKNFHLYENK